MNLKKTIQKLELTGNNIISLLIIIIIAVYYLYLIKKNKYFEKFRIGVQPSGPGWDNCPRCGYGCDDNGKCHTPPESSTFRILDNFKCPIGPGASTSDGEFNYDHCEYSNFYECYTDICRRARHHN
jgi:hypothetical protein